MWVLIRNGDGLAIQSTTLPEYVTADRAWLVTELDGVPWRYEGAESGFTVSGTAPPPPVPETVTPGQAKIALERTPGPAGGTLYDAVDSYISGLTDPAGKEIRIWWASATIFERANPHIAAVGAAFSLSDAQIDDLFRLAATIA